MTTYMDLSDAANLVRILNNIEKSIDAGRPDVAKEQIDIVRNTILKVMSKS